MREGKKFTRPKGLEKPPGLDVSEDQRRKDATAVSSAILNVMSDGKTQIPSELTNSKPKSKRKKRPKRSPMPSMGADGQMTLGGPPPIPERRVESRGTESGTESGSEITGGAFFIDDDEADVDLELPSAAVKEKEKQKRRRRRNKKSKEDKNRNSVWSQLSSIRVSKRNRMAPVQPPPEEDRMSTFGKNIPWMSSDRRVQAYMAGEENQKNKKKKDEAELWKEEAMKAGLKVGYYGDEESGMKGKICCLMSCCLFCFLVIGGGLGGFYFAVYGNVPLALIDNSPTLSPTQFPTDFPTQEPTQFPIASPTMNPTKSPTPKPTESPTKFPLPGGTNYPTIVPTLFPTTFPTESPTPFPTDTAFPTTFPTDSSGFFQTEEENED